MTIRENIVCGRTFSPNKYRQALAASCLARDLDQMENGDGAAVASGGNSLSGGQQMRVALARAVYVLLETSQASRLLVADDPLAALDAKVASAVFDGGLAHVLEGSTRVVAMSNLTFLRRPAITQVILLDGGHVVDGGSVPEVLTNGNTWVAESIWQASEPEGGSVAAGARVGEQPTGRKRRSAVLSESLVTHTEATTTHSIGENLFQM